MPAKQAHTLCCEDKVISNKTHTEKRERERKGTLEFRSAPMPHLAAPNGANPTPARQETRARLGAGTDQETQRGRRRKEAGSIPDSSAPASSLCGCCCSLPIAARKSLSIQLDSGKEAPDFAMPSRGSCWWVEWRDKQLGSPLQAQASSVKPLSPQLLAFSSAPPLASDDGARQH
jgi:hypothetical protein